MQNTFEHKTKNLTKSVKRQLRLRFKDHYYSAQKLHLFYENQNFSAFHNSLYTLSFILIFREFYLAVHILLPALWLRAGFLVVVILIFLTIFLVFFLVNPQKYRKFSTCKNEYWYLDITLYIDILRPLGKFALFLTFFRNFYQKNSFFLFLKFSSCSKISPFLMLTCH